ncbi:hypothetical protein E2I00_020018, partial [Balaenoptera physalus]
QGGDGEGRGAGSGAEGKKGVTQGRNKKELENKKEGGRKQARGTVGAPGTPLQGQCCPETPHPPPASGEFVVSLSKKDRAASDTREERPEHRNPRAAPEVGEGRLAGYGAWCQEPGWRDELGSIEGQGDSSLAPRTQVSVFLGSGVPLPDPEPPCWACSHPASQPGLVPAPAEVSEAARRKGSCSSQPRDSPQEEARLL